MRGAELCHSPKGEGDAAGGRAHHAGTGAGVQLYCLFLGNGPYWRPMVLTFMDQASTNMPAAQETSLLQRVSLERRCLNLRRRPTT